MPSAPGAIVPFVPFRSPVPLPTLGLGTVTRSFDAGWLPYVIGCCKALVATSTWDPPTQAQIDATIKAAGDLLLALQVPITPQGSLQGTSGPGDEAPFMLRQNPTNPCELQSSVDGVTWCTWADLSLCVKNPAPGSGTAPPGPTKCQDYPLKLSARSILVLPFLVNTGDTLTITSEMGAGTDGTLNWFCPDGSAFIAGACAGGAHLVGTDPLPTANHMSFLYLINGTYYPAVEGLFTVPGGITNQAVYLQVNDSTLGDNAGEYALHLNFCNNQAVPPTSWCQLLDFTLSPQGMTGETNEGIIICGGTDNGTIGNWVAGQGWKGTIEPSTDCVHNFSILRLYLALTPATVFTAEIKGSVSNTDSSSQLVVNGVNTVNPAAGGSNAINITPVPNGAFDYTGTTGIAKPFLDIFILMQNSSNGPTPDCTVSSIKLTGTGVNPFGSSNC